MSDWEHGDDREELRRAIKADNIHNGETRGARQAAYKGPLGPPVDSDVERCEDILNDSVSRVLTRWKIFQATMVTAGNPGLKPLYSGESGPAWENVGFRQRRRATRDFGWILYQSSYTVPILLRPDGRVGALDTQPIDIHLRQAARTSATIVDDYGDIDAIEEGMVTYVQEAMESFVKEWTAAFARILRENEINL